MFTACLSLLLLATSIHLVSGLDISPSRGMSPDRGISTDRGISPDRDNFTDRGLTVIVPHPPDSNFSMFDCFCSGSYGPHLPDCHAAIAMIPSPDPRTSENQDASRYPSPPNTTIPDFYSPLLSVGAPVSWPSTPLPQARSRLHRATRPRKSFGKPEFPYGGNDPCTEQAGGVFIPYYVTVIPTPKGFPGDGWQARLTRGVRDVAYHVYEPGGSASGYGTRGTWEPSPWLN